MIDNFTNKPFDCKHLNLRYLAIPKNGSSFVKEVIYQINNYDDCNKNNNFNTNAHHLYKNKDGYQISSFRNKPLIIFVRNPIKRFISGFNDRIVRKKELLSDIKDNNEKLKIFVDNFDFFIKNCPSIEWHFSPQFYFFKKYINHKNIQFYSVDDINFVLKRFFNKSNPDQEFKQYYKFITSKRANKTPKEFTYLSTANIPSECLNKIEIIYAKDKELFKKLNLQF